MTYRVSSINPIWLFKSLYLWPSSLEDIMFFESQSNYMSVKFVILAIHKVGRDNLIKGVQDGWKN